MRGAIPWVFLCYFGLFVIKLKVDSEVEIDEVNEYGYFNLSVFG